MGLTVRDMVAEMQREMRSEDLTPEVARGLLTKATSLFGNCLVEVREAEQDYAQVFLKCLESEEAAARAKIRAECTPEYQRKREARDTKELVLEMIRSLKYFLRSLEEEMKLAR